VKIKGKSDHRKPGFGLVVEQVEAYNQHREVVLVCDHILLVQKREL